MRRVFLIFARLHGHTKEVGITHPIKSYLIKWYSESLDASGLSGSTAQKYAWKIPFYKPRISVASESEFNHTNRILCLKVGVLVYSVKVCKMSWLSTGCLFIPWCLALPCCYGKQTAQFSVLWHARCWERRTLMRPTLLASFNCGHLVAWSCLKFFVCVWPKSPEHIY